MTKIGLFNRPFATSDHVVQNPPCWRASSLLFPHWDIKTKRPETVKLDLPLFWCRNAGIMMSLPSSMADLYHVIASCKRCINAVGHFRVVHSPSFKASLSAKLLLWKLVPISIWMKTDFHNKGFALSLYLKWRLRWTRKWPVQMWRMTTLIILNVPQFLCSPVFSKHFVVLQMRFKKTNAFSKGWQQKDNKACLFFLLPSYRV